MKRIFDFGFLIFDLKARAPFQAQIKNQKSQIKNPSGGVTR
jgi:hypothetical protein